MKEKKYEEAITSFETAIEKEQNESEAFRGVGIAQYELGNYEDALTAFNQALEFEDAVKTPTIYNLMGICSMKLTDYQGAVNNFNAGILVSENEKKIRQVTRRREKRKIQIIQKF
ncbi:tetratricopeptide repeat protein [Mediterraneibacter butyricigenes]|uniref:tetratricopeptide repeat protein n=1 Tax=Mediterraneibacter butyricigenes TaxID=2316025 RepID=UPI0014752731|nr:tetratricopeptide repeat protein [Mediterraneibacter butyricigenes]